VPQFKRGQAPCCDAKGSTTKKKGEHCNTKRESTTMLKKRGCNDSKERAQKELCCSCYIMQEEKFRDFAVTFSTQSVAAN